MAAGSKLGMPDSLSESESLSDFLLLERLALLGEGSSSAEMAFRVILHRGQI